MAMPGLRDIAKGNLGIMTLSAGIWTFAGQLNNPFQSLFILHLGGTPFQIGLIASIVITPLAIVGFANSRTFIQTLLVTILITVLGSMGMSSGQALFADLTEPHHRGRITAFWSITGTMRSFNLGASPGSLTGATGNLLGGYLYETHNKPTPLYLQSLMVALAAITGLLYLKESKNQPPIPTEE